MWDIPAVCGWKRRVQTESSGTTSHISITRCVIVHPGVYPPTGLIAQRINVYRGMGGYKPTAGLTEEAEGDAKVRICSSLLLLAVFWDQSRRGSVHFTPAMSDLTVWEPAHSLVHFNWTEPRNNQSNPDSSCCLMLIKMSVNHGNLLYSLVCNSKVFILSRITECRNAGRCFMVKG